VCSLTASVESNDRGVAAASRDVINDGAFARIAEPEINDDCRVFFHCYSPV
jgi:hypothetical protein